MSLGWDDLTPEGKKYFDQLAKLAKSEVQVGFQSGETNEDGVSYAEIAAFNELGSSNTPPRPFMKQSFENHQDELQEACDKVNNTLANGGTVESALETLGVTAKGIIQQEIVDGDFAPNAPSTIKAKGSDKPLIDTGRMRQSVNFVVKER